MKYCVKCGTQLEDNDVFCYKCGAKVVPNDNKTKQPIVSGPLPDSIGKIVKLFTVIIGTLLSVQVVLDLLGLFTNIFQRMLWYGVIDGLLHSFFNIVLSFMSLMAALCCAVLFLTYGLKRTDSNSSSLFMGLTLAFGFNVAIQCVALLFDTFHSVSGYIGLSAIGYIGLFALLYLNGDKTILTLDYSNGFEQILTQVRTDFMIAFGDLSQEAGKFAGEKMEDYKRSQAEKQAVEQLRQANVSGNSNLNDAKTPFTVGRRYVKDNRNIFVVIVLSLLTCNLYYYWMIYSVAMDANEMFYDDNETTGGLLAFILLSFVTCGFYAIYWEYKLANRIYNNASRFGVTVNETGTTVLLWYLVGLLVCGIGPYIALHLVLSNMNKIARVYNRYVDAPVYDGSTN